MNERIKKLRKALELTQQEFADKIGTKRNTVANYETNRNEPSNSVISLICREFCVNEQWLRTGEGEMFISIPSDTLDRLAHEYDLSRRGMAIIEKFLDLKPDIQEAIADYIEKVAATFSNDHFPAASALVPTPTLTVEEEARAEAEEYYRAILAEKEAAAGLSASPDSISGAKLA